MKNTKNIIQTLFLKTQKNGATEYEEKNSYAKALFLIKKYSFSISEFDLDSEIKEKLTKDLKVYNKFKPFEKYNCEEFFKWYDHNHDYFYDFGIQIENEIKQIPALWNCYENNPEFFNMYPSELKEDDLGWNYSDESWDKPNGCFGHYLVYSFNFFPNTTIEQSKEFFDKLSELSEKFFIDMSEINYSNNSLTGAYLTIFLKFSPDLLKLKKDVLKIK